MEITVESKQDNVESNTFIVKNYKSFDVDVKKLFISE
jgi:hypothetical protein